MNTSKLKILIALAIALCLCAALRSDAAPRKLVRIGFFEAGDYYTHSIIRNDYRDALEHLIPVGTQVVYMPNGFKSAEWKKDQCEAQAAALVRDTSIDMVVAIGPWVIPELLAAGYTRPIIGIFQNDPETEGLMDPARHPIADNLTFQTRPDQVRLDLTDMIALYRPKAIGVLAFNNGVQDTAFYQKCWKVGKSLGVDVVFAQGYSAAGVFAYFKGYQGLPRPMNAVYVAPLWGLSLAAINQFASNAFNDGIPVHTSEGRFLVEKGLSSSGSLQSEKSAAYFAAFKTAKIISGTIPADLPLEYPGMRGFVVNKSVLEVSGDRIPPEIWSQAAIVEEFALSQSTEVLTLAEALANAQSQSPSIQAMESRILAAEELLSENKRSYWPSLTLDGSATTAAKGASTNSGDLVSTERFRVGLQVDQPLYAPKILASITSAHKENGAARMTAQLTSLNVQRAVRAAYRDCLLGQQRVEELNRMRDRTEGFDEIARLRTFINADGPDDSPRMEMRRLELVRELIKARSDLQMRFGVLHALMGRPVLDTVMVLDSSGSTAGDFLDQFVPMRLIMSSRRFGEAAGKYLESEAAKNDASMRLKAAEIGLEESRLALARAGRRPSVGLRGWFGFVDSLANTPTLKEKHDIWSLSAQLTWPVISHQPGSSIRANREKMLSEKDSIRLAVAAGVRADWKRLWTQGLQLPLAAEARSKAQEYVDSVQFDYLRGRRSVVEVLDALQADLSASQEETNIRHIYFQSAEDLAGRVGWLTFDDAQPAGSILVKRIQEYLRTVMASEKKP